MSEKLILVGVDGSEQSRRALTWALAEAPSRGGAVKVVTTWVAGENVSADEAREEAANRQEAVVAAALAGIPSPPEIHREILPGDPVQVLCDASQDVELIVLGSHGMSQMRNVMLGSVTLGCVRFAHCPIVVIPVPYPGDEARYGSDEVRQAATPADY